MVMKGMSERAYAAKSGLSRGAVQKARKTGRLVLYPDGSINASGSDARRNAMTDPDQQMRARGGWSCQCTVRGSAWRWRSGWISRLICRVPGLPSAGAARRRPQMDRYLLATSGAGVRKIDGMSEADAPAFDTDMAQELQLQAANPLAARKARPCADDHAGRRDAALCLGHRRSDLGHAHPPSPPSAASGPS